MRLDLARVAVTTGCVLTLGGCLDLYLIAQGGTAATTSGGAVASTTSSFTPASSFSSPVSRASSSSSGTLSSGGVTSAGSSGGVTSSTSNASSSDVGSSSSTGPAAATVCQEQCVISSDCLADFSCVLGRCVYNLTPPPCVGALECVSLFTGWTGPCSDDSGCALGYACISVSGGGVCALVATIEGDNCSPAGWAATEYNSFQTGAPVVVCAETRAECLAGNCRLRCLGDNHCTSSEYPFCNTVTGSCECQAGTCTSNASLCVNGQCQCQIDGDCTRGNVNHCFSGVCGCFDTGACVGLRAHPNTSYVCE